MQYDNFFLKSWTILNDSDSKSKFTIRLYYDNKIEIVSHYKIKEQYRVFLIEEFQANDLFTDPKYIGELCFEVYNRTMEKLKLFDKILDNMETIEHVEFLIEKENE